MEKVGQNYIPYKDIFDSIPDGIIITTKDLKIISVNESSENLLNISRKKATGKKLSRYFPDEITDICKKVISEERIIYEDELIYRTPLNSTIKIEFTGSPFYSSDGNVSGLTIQIKDKEKINFLTKMDKQENMEESYEFLARGLAHELKNPLSGIKGAAQLLSTELNSTEISKCSEIIVKEVDRLRDLTNKIRGIDSFDKGSFKEVNIHELLFDIIFLESKIKDNVEFKHFFDITIPPIIADKDSIKQVLINIVKNAGDAIKSNGEITLSTKWVTDYKLKDKNSVLISIKDNGIGIDKKNIKKIFTPFFSNKKKGSGLGLFISNQIVTKHGGFILVDSKPDEGTEFKIYLPTGN